MEQQTFQAEQYRELSYRQWEQTAAGWHEWASTRAQLQDKLVETVLDVAKITVGSRVLDVAAGDGDLSVRIAQQVGEDGYVLTTDVAENMVAYAEHAAHQAGLPNMDTRVMDGENLTVDSNSFDAVICSFGLMLFADPQQGLAEAYRVLKQGGRYAATVFTTPDRNPWLAIPAKVAFQHADRPMPPPDAPGLFALGRAGQLADLMQAAGFRQVESRTYSLPLKMESAEECATFVRETAGAVSAVLTDLDEQKRREAWQAVREALRQFEHQDGFVAPSEVLLVSGEK